MGPASTPVTTPAFVTVTRDVLLLLQVPPVVGVTVAVRPSHTDVAPPKTGSALTVMDLVAIQPLEDVKVKVTVPALTPVTRPSAVTVALASLPLLQLPLVFAVTDA